MMLNALNVTAQEAIILLALATNFRIIGMKSSTSWDSVPTPSCGWRATTHEKTQSCVAIKVSIASATGSHGECDILWMLSSKTTAPSSRKTMLPLILDEFDIKGPNGRHHCTVTLPARMSINDAKDASRCRLFQLSVARAITAQLINGVAWLHSLGNCSFRFVLNDL